MAISGLLGQQNLQRLEFRFRPDRDVYARLPSPVEVEISNHRRWLPAFLIRVATEQGSVLFPLLPAGQTQRLQLSLIFPDRGYQTVPPLLISSSFPINFFVRMRDFSLEQQLLVYPRPIKGEVPFGSGRGRQSRQLELPQPGFDGELRNIDNYRAGDPLKAIHWKHSARQEEYKVKRQNRLGAPSLLIELQQLPGSIEEKLSRCTYLIDQLSRRQRPVGVQFPEKFLAPALGTRHRHKLLAELALYGRR